MKRLIIALAIFASLVAVSACTASPDAAEEVGKPTTVAPGEAPVDSPAAGMRLANGLYDIEGDKVQAIGILEWVDVEGGFFAITGKPESEGGGNIAVIANGDEFKSELEPLKGKLVNVIGKRLDGASVRMAGPEIEMESIAEMSDTPGIAE